MLDQMVVIYCNSDEIVKILKIKEDVQCKMTTSEVITFSKMSALIFGCDYRKTRLVAFYNKFFPKY